VFLELNFFPKSLLKQNNKKRALIKAGAGGSRLQSCYSGGRDQEDHGLKPARQIVFETLSQKTHHKKGLVE
jgi:hypothetical protein